MSDVSLSVEHLTATFWNAYRDAAERVFYLGSTPWEVDEAMEALGVARGPFEREDDIGLDVAFARQRGSLTGMATPLLVRMVELGKLGRSTGAGWYRYPGGGGKVDDPIVADLALEEAHFHDLQRFDYSVLEIQQRITAVLMDTAARLAAAGVSVQTLNLGLCAALEYPSVEGVFSRLAQGHAAPYWISVMTTVKTEGYLPQGKSPDVTSLMASA